MPAGFVQIRNLKPDFHNNYKINCILLGVNNKSIHRPYIQLYFTDFTHNEQIGPQGSLSYNFSIGNIDLNQNQILTVQIFWQRYHELCKKLIDVIEDDAINGSIELFLNLQKQTIYYIGVLCEIEITNLKSFRNVLESDLKSIKILNMQQINSSANNSLELVARIINGSGPVYLNKHIKYLQQIVPNDLLNAALSKYQRNMTTGFDDINFSSDEENNQNVSHNHTSSAGAFESDNSMFESDHEISFYDILKKEEAENINLGMLNSNIIADENYGSVNKELDEHVKKRKIKDFSQSSQLSVIAKDEGTSYDLINDAQTLDEFEEVAPYVIEDLNKNIENIIEGKEYVIQGKIVDFNEDNTIIAYKVRKHDLPKPKIATITVTDYFNDEINDEKELRNFVVTEKNCLKLELDSVEEILNFFEVDEIEELYVRQEELVEKVYAAVARQFKAVHFHQRIEFRIYKKLRRVHPNFSYYAWGVKGLCISDLK